MFARNKRLLSSLRDKDKTLLRNTFFTLQFVKNNLVYNRYGFIVSKKIDLRASIRNRTKRRFRACLVTLDSKLKPGYDMLFFITKEAVGTSTDALLRAISQSLDKKGLIA